MSTNKEVTRFILDNSPTEFVMTGPLGRHRGVLVRSREAKIDLIGSADEGAEQARSILEPGQNSPFRRLFWTGYEIHVANSVKQVPHISSSSIAEDRLLKYKFIWRGLSSKSDLTMIEKMFSDRSIDIVNAFESGNLSELEWQISPIIYVCHEITIRRKNEKNVRAIASIIFLALYIFLIVLFLVKFLPNFR